MNVTLWGTRGSLATPGPKTARWGGNTSCVELRGADGQVLIMDAGTGIRPLSGGLGPGLRRVDILLTHLHLDHVQGLGFFGSLYRPEMEVHIWGPPSTTLHLRDRLARYLSPPLFPVQIRDLPSRLTLHDLPLDDFAIGDLRVRASLICHPGPTVGYRVNEDGSTVVYMPDHEPALGARRFPDRSDWTSGFELAEGADLLIHDSQYTSEEYAEHVGWGHSSLPQALAFAAKAGAKKVVTFHHAPDHDDAMLDRMVEEARRAVKLPFTLVGGTEGATFTI